MCGTSLQPPSLAEERKFVTVLFADIVASTELSGAIDPEQMRARVSKFFSIAREEIERYGGTVEKFIGDAVMAVFGLSMIHEDDPERGARAAIAMRLRVRPDIDAGLLPEIRIGINTGEVVANPQAAAKGEFLVTGEVVSLAARLQQAAAPGQVLVGERTMHAIRPLAQVRGVLPLTVKGTAAPLPAWELLEVAPPRERALRATPFVGREEELELLRGYLRRMRREGRGHVVTILGPAGVGKTRIVREFQAQIQETRILRGRAIPYGGGVPFWSLGEAIREECGILFGDPLELARRKLQTAATQLDVADAVPALRAVLGLGGEGPELTRELLFAGLRAFFQALAHRSPLLLILEDCHSAEDVTLDFVEHAADWIREVSVLLLVLSRPELLERRPSWMGGKRSATTLFLDSLGSEESRNLLSRILGEKLAPGPLVDLVLERSGGNPLFMEELLRALIERGVLAEEPGRWILRVSMTEVSIPDTIHAVIAARVDALRVSEKSALQNAAILGNDFWLGGLRVVADEDHVDESVRALVDKELLIHKRRSTLIGEEEFTFRHILIRDVAYTMIPKSQRWLKHARFAEWMQQIAGDRRAEFADIIAHHWMQVVTLHRELGVPPDPNANAQAIANLLLAGDRAAAVYANTTALDHYTRVLELDPESTIRFRVLLGRGEVWMLLGQYEKAREDFISLRTQTHADGQRRLEAIALDHVGISFRKQDQIEHALESLESALAISREVGEALLTGRILNHIGFTYFSDGKHEEAIRAHDEARRLLDAGQDLAGLAESFHGLGENALFQQRWEESIPLFEESVKRSGQVGNRSLAAENGYMIAHARHMLGDYLEAQAEAQRSVTTLIEIGDVWNCSSALWNAAEISATLGDFGKALEQATRGSNLARQIGAVRFTVFNLLALGRIQREIENYRDAWRADREAVDLARTVGGAPMPSALAALALDAIALGRKDEAHAYVREAREILHARQSRIDFPSQVAHTEGRLLLAMGRAAEAHEAAQTLSNLVTASGILHWRVPALLLLADALVALENWETAARTYQEAVNEAERTGRMPALWRALAGLAKVQRSMGESDQAAECAARAREIIDRLSATVPDERLRATFLQSPEVQHVVFLAGT